MNQARANQVLNDISNSMDVMESNAERLCILIAEARREGYWRIRYRTEEEWCHTVFKASRSWFYRLAKAGEAFYDNPGIISEIGVNKAALIAPFANSADLPEWISKARAYEKSVLRGDVMSRLCTPAQIERRIGMLVRKISTKESEIIAIRKEIDDLRSRIEQQVA